MTKMKRKYTMVFSFLCYDKSKISECNDRSQLPFPSQKSLRNQKLPVFEISEEIVIN